MRKTVTQADIAVAERLAARGASDVDPKKLTAVESWRQGNFTLVRAWLKSGQRLVERFGIAKRNCDDDQEAITRGREIALARALRGDARHT